MKQQYIKLFSILIGLSLIISGVIYVFSNMYKEDRARKLKNEQIIADEISDIYKSFFDVEKELTAERDKLVKEYLEYSSYYSNMPKGYNAMKEKIAAYEEKVTQAEDVSAFLKKSCEKKYSINSANDKCIAYYINLERTINTFIGDIEKFNVKIDEYNVWTEEENKSVLTTTKYELLEKFVSTKYKEHVDLNNDGTYLGEQDELGGE